MISGMFHMMGIRQTIWNQVIVILTVLTIKTLACTWISYRNMQGIAYESAIQYDVTTFEQCYSRCLMINFCDYGFTWNSNPWTSIPGQQCSLSLSGESEVADQSGRTFYRCLKGDVSTQATVSKGETSSLQMESITTSSTTDHTITPETEEIATITLMQQPTDGSNLTLTSESLETSSPRRCLIVPSITYNKEAVYGYDVVVRSTSPYLAFQDCQQACAADINCMGFDWTDSSASCRISTTTLLQTNNEVIHHELSCRPCSWVQYNNMQGTASASVIQWGLTTIEQCFAKCLVSNFCDYGLTWNSNGDPGQQCSLSEDGVSEVADQPGKTFYRCLKGDFPTQATVSEGIPTSLQMESVITSSSDDHTTNSETEEIATTTLMEQPTDGSNLTLTSQSPETSSLRRCIIASITYNKESVHGYDVVVGSTSPFQDCLQACAADINCMGFDWTASSVSCRISTTTLLQTNDGVIHHELSCRPCTWVQYDNVQGKASNTQWGLTTIQQCLAACLIINFCDYGFTWNSNGDPRQQCSLSGDDESEASDQPGRTFYRCLKAST